MAACQDRLEPALKQVPHQRVALVECLGVHGVHMPHQPRQVAHAVVRHQVEVIAHQAVSQHLRVKGLHGLRRDRQLPSPIFILEVNRLTAVTARGDVIDAGDSMRRGRDKLRRRAEDSLNDDAPGVLVQNFQSGMPVPWRQKPEPCAVSPTKSTANCKPNSRRMTTYEWPATRDGEFIGNVADIEPSADAEIAMRALVKESQRPAADFPNSAGFLGPDDWYRQHAVDGRYC